MALWLIHFTVDQVRAQPRRLQAFRSSRLGEILKRAHDVVEEPWKG